MGIPGICIGMGIPEIPPIIGCIDRGRGRTGIGNATLGIIGAGTGKGLGIIAGITGGRTNPRGIIGGGTNFVVGGMTRGATVNAGGATGAAIGTVVNAAFGTVAGAMTVAGVDVVFVEGLLLPSDKESLLVIQAGKFEIPRPAIAIVL